jgi:hypothetical protein
MVHVIAKCLARKAVPTQLSAVRRVHCMSQLNTKLYAPSISAAVSSRTFIMETTTPASTPFAGQFADVFEGAEKPLHVLASPYARHTFDVTSISSAPSQVPRTRSHPQSSGFLVELE